MGGGRRLSQSPGCFSGVRRETGPGASSAGGSQEVTRGRGRREGEAAKDTSIPRDGPGPPQVPVCRGNGRGRGLWRGGPVRSLPRGRGGEVVWRFEPCKGLGCGARPRGEGTPAPGPAALAYTCQAPAGSSRRRTQEKQLRSLRGKEDQLIHHSIEHAAAASCPHKHARTRIL